MAKRRLALNLSGIDYPLLLTVAILLVVGLVMVYSASFGLNMDTLGHPNPYYLERQALWAAIGAAALVGMALIDFRTWRTYSLYIMVGALAVLLPLAIVGIIHTVSGSNELAARWVLGKSVQPSELVKLAVIIYVAAWLASKGEKIQHLTYGLLPFGIMLGLVCGLILLQPNMSTALLIGGTAVAMFFAAGAKVAQLVISFVLVSPLVAGLVWVAPYRLNRVLTLIRNPLLDPWGPGYQTARAIFAFQTGGLFGVGLGGSVQKMGYLYAPHTDAIFAVLGEELGLFGGLAVMTLYAVLAYRGLRIALRCNDPFGTLLATGITSWLVLQAMLNIAAVTATLPFTGVTLPFVSFGGSSLVACMAGIGLLLNVSRGGQGVRSR